VSARLFLRLQLRPLLEHRFRTALVTMAVAVSVAMVVATSLVGTSIREALRQQTADVAGIAPIRVEGTTSRGGLDAGVVDEITRTPGVAAAAPMVQAVTIVDGADGGERAVIAIGVDCRLAALIEVPCDESLVASSGPDTPVVSERLRASMGAGGTIRTNRGPVAVASVGAPGLDRLNDGRIAVFALPAAQEVFSRPDRVDRVYVLPDRGAEASVLTALRRTLDGRAHVRSAADPPVGPDVAGAIVPLLGLFALVTLGVMIQLVYRVMSVVLEDQRRSMAILNVLGAARHKAVIAQLVTAVALGLVGSALGIGLGVGLAEPLLDAPRDLIESFFGAGLTVQVDPPAVGLGLATGVVACLVATVVPARRQARMDVSRELTGRLAAVGGRDGRQSRWYLAVAAAALAGVAASVLGARDGALDAVDAGLVLWGTVVSGVATVTVIGGVVPWALQRLARVRRLPPLVRMGLKVGAADRARTRVVAGSIAAAVLFAAVLSALVVGVQEGSAAFAEEQAAGRVWASTLPPVNSGIIDAKTPPDTVAAIAALPEVAALEPVSRLQIETRRGTGVGVTAVANEVNRPFRLVTGRDGPESFARGEVMIGPALARAERLAAGDELDVLSLDGPAALRVGGVWDDPNDNGYALMLPLDHAEELWGTQPPSELYLVPATGSSAADVVRAVDRMETGAPLDAATGPEVGRMISDDLGEQLATFWLLGWELYLAASVVAGATMVLALRSRRSDLATLATLGAGRRDILLLVAAENGAIGLVSGVLAAVGAGAVFVALRGAIYVLLSLSPPMAVDPLPTVGFAAAAVIVLAGSGALAASRFDMGTVARSLRDG
jgi:putative ABC transport system permease protein